MAKIETEQERNDRDFRNRINGTAQERIAQFGEQVKESLAKATEAAEAKRKKKLAREAGCCFAATAGIAGLYLAQGFGLISPVLADPAIAFLYVYAGWHLCMFGVLGGHK
jgi:hypothetical protein